MKIAILKSVWTALTTKSKMGAKYAPFLVALGEPTIWWKKTNHNQEWCVFSDTRIKPEDVAYVAAIMQNPNIVNIDLEMPATHAEAKVNHQIARDNRPTEVDLTSWLGDPADLTAVIAAQGNAVKNRMKAGNDVDDELEPKVDNGS